MFGACAWSYYNNSLGQLLYNFWLLEVGRPSGARAALPSAFRCCATGFTKKGGGYKINTYCQLFPPSVVVLLIFPCCCLLFKRKVVWENGEGLLVQSPTSCQRRRTTMCLISDSCRRPLCALLSFFLFRLCWTVKDDVCSFFPFFQSVSVELCCCFSLELPMDFSWIETTVQEVRDWPYLINISTGGTGN